MDKLKAKIGRPPTAPADRAKTRTIRLTDSDFLKLKALGMDRLRAWLCKAN